MAAYAALTSLINNIHRIIKHPRLSTSFDNTLIQPLLHKAGFLLHFMEANNYGGGSKESQDLEREIASAAHAAEDVIESHIVDQINAGTSEKSLRCSLDLRQKIQDIDDVLTKANDFQEKYGAGEEQKTQVARPAVEIGETSAMVGLNDELDQLVRELTRHQSEMRIHSIVGMGGMGKTTLAKNIFQHPLTKENFHCRAWATISQQHNARDTLSQLLSGLGKSINVSVPTIADLGLELHQNLTGRRYLIILDDMWSVEAWNEVRRFLPDNKNGSRVVLTTRLSNVAKDCVSSPFVMNLLDEVKSWELFCEKAFRNEPCPPELREVGEETVKLCKGLALSIVVMGGILLNSPRTVEYWEGVLRDIKSIPDSKQKHESLDVLSLSYTHLPPHLKPCFLYMGMFEEDSEIHVSNVIQLWVAEGFIKPNESGVLEEIAEGYLKDLIDRNLILVGRRRKNGKIKCCGIHDLLRDLCLKVSQEKQFFCEISKSLDIGSTDARLVYASVSHSVYDFKMVPLSLARSIITYKSSYKPDKNRLLRVWSQDRAQSAEKLYERVNLRYLAYEHPYGGTLWKIPTSVFLIWNLQTLIIKELPWYSLVVAPIEFWKMRQIRHVECSKIYLPWSNGEDELLILDNLHTLKTALNFKLSEEVCKIIPNITKLHLYYDHELHGYDDCLIEHLSNLGQLHKLESLSVRSTVPKRILTFPSLLNKLSLRGCGLQWEDLTVIGSLPRLEVLLLERSSVQGREWSPVNGEFRNLKFLKIDGNVDHVDRINGFVEKEERSDLPILEDLILEQWNAERSHFPVLEKLVLMGCRHLKEIPLDIGEIPTLQLICLDKWCSISAAVSAVKIKEEQLENLGDDSALEVQLKMNYENVASLKEMVSINNVQLEIV